MKEICAGGVIYYKKDKSIYYLLLKSAKTGWWVFPKGHVKNSENLQGTAIREIKEETNLSNLKMVTSYHEIIKFINQAGKEKEVHHFLFSSNTTLVKISQEHMEFKWLEFEKAYALVDHENQKKVLKKAHEVLLYERD